MTKQFGGPHDIRPLLGERSLSGLVKAISRTCLVLLGIFGLLNLGHLCRDTVSNAAGECVVEIRSVIPDAWTLILFIAFSMAFGGWTALRAMKQEWTRPLRRLLLPLSIGFGLDILLLITLSVVQPSLDAQWPRAIEEFAVRFRIWVHGFSDFGLGRFLLILGALFIFTCLLPKWKFVTRFLVLQQCVSTVFIILMSATTFSFFGRKPLDQRASTNQEVTVREYKISLRQEWDAVGKYMAAQYIAADAHELNANDRQQLTNLARAITEVARKAPHWPAQPGGPPLAIVYRGSDIDFQKITAQVLGKSQLQAVLSPTELQQFVTPGNTPEPQLPEEKALSTIPATVDELRSQQHLVEAERSRAQKLSEQAKAALDAAIAAVAGTLVPEIQGSLGDYFRSWVDALGDLLSPMIERRSRNIGKHIPIAELFEWLGSTRLNNFRIVRKILALKDENASVTIGNHETAALENEVERVAKEKLPAELAKEYAEFKRAEYDRAQSLIEERMREARERDRPAER